MAPNPPESELPQRLRDDLETLHDKLHRHDNLVLPIVGAELSEPALPPWRSFLDRLIERTEGDLRAELDELRSGQRYLDIADLLESEVEVGRPLINQQIERFYQRPVVANPGGLHDLVAALPVTHFASLHFDPWLKEAVNRRYPAARVYSPGDPSAFSDLGSDSSPLVLMLRGDADRAEQCIISRAGYRRLMHGAPDYRQALLALASQRSFLFIGHSLTDLDLRHLLETWKENSGSIGAAPRHYVLAARVTHLARCQLPELGVLPIECRAQDGTNLLPAVLRYLATPPDEIFDASDLDAALTDYAHWISAHDRLRMPGLGEDDPGLPMDDIFVPLRYSVDLRRDHHHRQRNQPPRHERSDRDQALPLEQVFERVAPARHLFILGHPGSGKTTALQKLARMLVAGRKPFGGVPLGLPDGTVPVFFRLRNLRPADLRASIASRLARWLASEPTFESPDGFGTSLWQRGRLLLLLDGLDEVRDDMRVKVCDWVQEQLRAAEAAGHHDIRAVVSCRYAGKTGLVGFDERFAELTINTLNDEQIAAFCRQWFEAAERTDTAAHGGDQDAAAPRGRRYGEALAATLRRPDHASREFKTLIANPLLLTLLCMVVKADDDIRGRQDDPGEFTGEIPTRRVTFFDRCLRARLECCRGEALLSIDDARLLLEPLAWSMQTAGDEELSRDQAVAILKPEIKKLRNAWCQSDPSKRLTPSRILHSLTENSGVLTEFVKGQTYGFMHLSLQEYLAAKAVIAGCHVDVLARKLDDPSWCEVALLFAALRDHELFGPWLRAVIDAGEVAQHEGLLRRCLQEASAPDIGPLVEFLGQPAPTEEELEASLRLLEPWARSDERAQAAAARLAGRVDPGSDVHSLATRIASLARPLTNAAQPGEPFEEARTGIRFLWIPGGRFRMGLAELTSNWLRNKLSAMPAHSVEMSPFWLAETPVTNQQYEHFMNATGRGEPKHWRDSRFNGPLQPVVGVTWMDAQAFCDWLAEQPGKRVVLPTEAQWEFAARGEDNRRYPWGDDVPDKTRAHYAYNHGAMTSPVGHFPAGMGPFGTLDQAGNVWEWCRDSWDEKAYKGRGELTIDPLSMSRVATMRAFRGGSWANSAEDLHTAFRDGDDVSHTADGIGFRVACALSGPGP